ncbi:hypothetical protein SLS62_006199 [Diatrype stigma]|uniref:Uncharacterized protein n=1 Tax=Diatrype stigma TaxID=117547 RepID=A0AAN9V1L6_9PEZI
MLYQLVQGGYCTVNWILDRSYNRDDHITVFDKTQIVTVNKHKDSIVSLTVRDNLEMYQISQPGRQGFFCARELSMLNVQMVKDQPQTWVKFKTCKYSVLVNVVMITNTFLGETEGKKFPTQYFTHKGLSVPTSEFMEDEKGGRHPKWIRMAL